ncbi:hypothetical protein V8E36_000192, partial [Tilletia maclaganii]
MEAALIACALVLSAKPDAVCDCAVGELGDRVETAPFTIEGTSSGSWRARVHSADGPGVAWARRGAAVGGGLSCSSSHRSCLPSADRGLGYGQDGGRADDSCLLRSVLQGLVRCDEHAAECLGRSR